MRSDKSRGQECEQLGSRTRVSVNLVAAAVTLGHRSHGESLHEVPP